MNTWNILKRCISRLNKFFLVFIGTIFHENSPCGFPQFEIRGTAKPWPTCANFSGATLFTVVTCTYTSTSTLYANFLPRRPFIRLAKNPRRVDENVVVNRNFPLSKEATRLQKRFHYIILCIIYKNVKVKFNNTASRALKLFRRLFAN